jgi:hypothetical protein
MFLQGVKYFLLKRKNFLNFPVVPVSVAWVRHFIKTKKLFGVPEPQLAGDFIKVILCQDLNVTMGNFTVLCILAHNHTQAFRNSDKKL